MEIKNLEDCFKYRKLRKIAPDIEKSRRSLEISKERLKNAKNALKTGKYFLQYILVECYTSMFHASRAILYRDGIQEKSHYAVFIYLKENYSGKIPSPIINILNIYRIERHEAMYGLDYSVTEEEAKKAIIDAEKFIFEIEKIL